MTTAISNVTPTAPPSGTTAARNTLSENFETFLTLLTAQLQYQDPLDPLDSSEFTNQLVQYSQVEQQLSTNDKLDQLLARDDNAATNAALGFLGQTASLDSPVSVLENGRADWAFQLERAATDVRVEVVNAAGTPVYTTQLSGAAGPRTFTWDGKSTGGVPQAPGPYSLRITAKDGVGQSVPAAINSDQEITGVDLSDPTGPRLLTRGGSWTLDEVLAVKTT